MLTQFVRRAPLCGDVPLSAGRTRSDLLPRIREALNMCFAMGGAYSGKVPGGVKTPGVEELPPAPLRDLDQDTYAVSLGRTVGNELPRLSRRTWRSPAIRHAYELAFELSFWLLTKTALTGTKNPNSTGSILERLHSGPTGEPDLMYAPRRLVERERIRKKGRRHPRGDAAAVAIHTLYPYKSGSCTGCSHRARFERAAPVMNGLNRTRTHST